MYVRDLMTPRVIDVSPSDPLELARQRLEQNHIHHLVVRERENVVGIISFRDLIGKKDGQTVGDVMSHDVLTIEASAPLRRAAALMLGRTHGCLPVVEGGKVAGVITTSDLMRAVSSTSSHA